MAANIYEFTPNASRVTVHDSQTSCLSIELWIRNISCSQSKTNVWLEAVGAAHQKLKKKETGQKQINDYQKKKNHILSYTHKDVSPGEI